MEEQSDLLSGSGLEGDRPLVHCISLDETDPYRLSPMVVPQSSPFFESDFPPLCRSLGVSLDLNISSSPIVEHPLCQV